MSDPKPSERDFPALRIDLKSEWVQPMGWTMRYAVPRGFPSIFDLSEEAGKHPRGEISYVETEEVQYQAQRLVIGDRALMVYIPTRFMEAWGPLVEIMDKQMRQARAEERAVILAKMDEDAVRGDTLQSDYVPYLRYWIEARGESDDSDQGR